MNLASCSRPPVRTSHPFSQRRKRVTSIGSARVECILSLGFPEYNLRVFLARRELMDIFCSPILLGHPWLGRSRYPMADVQDTVLLLLQKRLCSIGDNALEQFGPTSFPFLVVLSQPSPLTWRSAGSFLV